MLKLDWFLMSVLMEQRYSQLFPSTLCFSCINMYQIVVQSKKSRPEQGWTYNPVTEVFTSKRPASSGRTEGNFALDIQNAKKQAGVNVVIFSKRHQNNNKSQRWYLSSVNKAPQSAPPPAIGMFTRLFYSFLSQN